MTRQAGCPIFLPVSHPNTEQAMTNHEAVTVCLTDKQGHHVHAVVRCAYCEAPVTNPERLFEDMCDPCGREYACANPASLGPDA